MSKPDPVALAKAATTLMKARADAESAKVAMQSAVTAADAADAAFKILAGKTGVTVNGYCVFADERMPGGIGCVPVVS